MSKQPAKTVPGIVELIDKTCKELNISSQKITSGAYHDALSMVKMADIGMIFVPSVNGVSHAPEEFTHFEDIYREARVLCEVLVKLAQ